MCSNKCNYTALASFLSAFPDVLAIKRFRELQIRNLLFYQAELAHLEAELQKIEDQDAQQKPDPSDFINFRWTPCMAREAPASTETFDCPADKESSGGRSGTRSRETTVSSYREKVLQIRRTLASYSKSTDK